MNSQDLQPRKRNTAVPRRLDEEAIGCYAEWLTASAAVDAAYFAWSYASADESAGAFAAYRAALDHEEFVATIYGAAIDRPIRASQPIRLERSSEELHIAGDQSLRVLIADHDGFARRMLQRVLEDVGGVATTTGARDGREALELARQYRPRMLLVDITLPPAGGVELIRKVVPILPRVRIVTVSAATDRDQSVLAALRAGAIGHIDKDTAPEQIAQLVALAAAGEAIVPRRLMTRPLARWRLPPRASERAAP